MGQTTSRRGRQMVMRPGQLDQLIGELRKQGRHTIGPTVRGAAIVYDEIHSIADLPRGWTETQTAGRYRLQKRDDEALFGFAAGPHSWKRFLHPPQVRLWTAEKTRGGLQIDEEPPRAPLYAFIGVRACDLAAIAVQDRVFLQGPFVDPVYRSRREQVFLLVVNCGEPGGTCFCASMQTGPAAKSGFDLALTEVLEGDDHYFVTEVGSNSGHEAVAPLDLPAAGPNQLSAAERTIREAGLRMGRSLDTSHLKALLYANLEHPRWEAAGRRCLGCANCTMVCPTCFCTSVEDSTDLSGKKAERRRNWDSCFTVDFSYIHGGAVRVSTAARYRQWLTHKLGSWEDQFGTSGCVGCGRCIAWCPVGIDLTEEVSAIRGSNDEPVAEETNHGDA